MSSEAVVAKDVAKDTAAVSVIAAFERRVAPARDLVEHASQVTDAALGMAVRFHHGGKLLAFGIGSASTDAQHIAVEFVHPVIVGKRAFPAISLTTDIATQTAIAARAGMADVFAHQLGKLGEPSDIALGISADGDCPSVLAGLIAARNAGLLTVALVGRGGGAIAANSAADHLLIAGSADPRVIKEIHVTMYHLLWELVHVFIEQPSVLSHGDEACVTCSDAAVPGTVMALLDDGLAIVGTAAGEEEVSVALVEAGVGDTVVVHAGEAIAVIPT
jgi:D-sedoheptulose 7-phosphate isomerase